MTKTLIRGRSHRTKTTAKGNVDDSAVHVSSSSTIAASYAPKHELRSVKSSISPSSKADSFFDDSSSMPFAPSQYSAGPMRRPLAPPKSIPIVLPPEAQGYSFGLPPSKSILYAELIEDKSIGVALGSPTHLSQSKPPPPLPKDPVITGEVITTVTSQAQEDDDLSKQRVRRWKSIFKKTAGNNSSPSLSLAASRVQAESLSSPRGQSPSLKSNVTPRSSPRIGYAPEADRNHGKPKSSWNPGSPGVQNIKSNSSKPLPPVDNKPRKTSSAAEKSPPPPPKDYHRTARIPKVTVSRAVPFAPPPSLLGSGPLLDVDIPDVQMERYSIMFDSVLKGDRSSSLLARRQVTNERLKPLDEVPLKPEESIGAGWPKPQRRATSPSYNSPRLTLFPPSNPRDPKPAHSRLHEPRPLQRSNTSPAALSPNKMTFPRVVDTPPHSNYSNSFPFTTPSPSAQSFDEEEIFRTTTQTSQPWADEPAWEMVTKPSAKPSTKPAAKPRREVVRPAKPETEKNMTPQIAIARKVSVTRAQRHLIKPQVKSPERLVNRMPLTPTVVELGKLDNRASQRVLIENA